MEITVKRQGNKGILHINEYPVLDYHDADLLEEWLEVVQSRPDQSNSIFKKMALEIQPREDLAAMDDYDSAFDGEVIAARAGDLDAGKSLIPISLPGVYMSIGRYAKRKAGTNKAPLENPPCHELAPHALRGALAFYRGGYMYSGPDVEITTTIPLAGIATRKGWDLNPDKLPARTAYILTVAPHLLDALHRVNMVFSAYRDARGGHEMDPSGMCADDFKRDLNRLKPRLEHYTLQLINGIIDHEVANSPATRDEMVAWFNRIARREILTRNTNLFEVQS